MIPYASRHNEAESNVFGRLTTAIQEVRNARKATGALNPDGTPKYLWLAYSQTPERRKRARYAGKVKRLLLEQGAEKGDIQVEFATGTLWCRGRRVASATAPPPHGQTTSKSPLGWLDPEAVATFTGKTKEVITAAWQSLLDPQEVHHDTQATVSRNTCHVEPRRDLSKRNSSLVPSAGISPSTGQDFDIHTSGNHP